MGPGMGWADRPGPAGLGHPGPARGLLCSTSVPLLPGCFSLLHVGPCRQFLSELGITPCLARFSTFLVRSSEFVVFSDQVTGFLELSLLHCMTCTGLQGLVIRCLMNLSRKSSFQR
jgi:hypothetical protein